MAKPILCTVAADGLSAVASPLARATVVACLHSFPSPTSPLHFFGLRVQVGLAATVAIDRCSSVHFCGLGLRRSCSSVVLSGCGLWSLCANILRTSPRYETPLPSIFCMRCLSRRSLRRCGKGLATRLRNTYRRRSTSPSSKHHHHRNHTTTAGSCTAIQWRLCRSVALTGGICSTIRSVCHLLVRGANALTQSLLL